jgi:hypothetical protein
LPESSDLELSSSNVGGENNTLLLEGSSWCCVGFGEPSLDNDGREVDEAEEDDEAMRSES